MLTEQEERDLLQTAEKLELIKRYEELGLGSIRTIKEAQNSLRFAVRASRKQRENLS